MSGTTEAISPSTPAASSTGPASNDSLESAPSKDVSDSTPSVADPASAGDSAPVASPVAAVGPASKDKEDPPGSSSASSTASGATSDDYEIVSKDAVSAAATKPPATSSSTALKAPTLDIVIGGGKEEDLKESLEDCLLTSSPEEEEKKDPKAENDPVSQPDDEGEHTVFHKIVHCGSQPIQQPKNEENIQGQIRDANQHSADRVVTLSVPKSSEGWVHVRGDPPSPSVKPLKFPICRIIFFARGNADTSEAACFAFTCVHGETPEERHFITHIFRCEVPEAVSKVFVSFAQAFKRSNPVRVVPPENFHEQEPFLFELTLEIREKEEAKGGATKDHVNPIYEIVPRHKGLFKLRSNVEKKVVVTVQQISRNSCHLNVERCFGMLVSPGRNVRHADMQLLEHVTMATTTSNNTSGNADPNNAADSAITHIITGSWDPGETAFAVLNQETPSDIQSVYVTIAADLVIQQVGEPVRFVIETKARIYPTNEKYWYYARKNLTKQYQVRLKRSPQPQGDKVFDVCGIDISEEVDRNKMSLTSQFANFTMSTLGSFRNPIGSNEPGYSEQLSPSREEEEEDDGEEPLLSGFGEVSKDCSGTELEQWSQVLLEWDKDNPLSYPKQLPPLVRRGIPEALRGEVWQRMTGASIQMDEIIETYRILTTKESPDEKVILRDIHRTFPAHEFFKEAGGVGQEALYRISKAYSVYDSEVGYCQGQSFLIAALLLQMPEEQSFGVLVKVMHRHGLRDMFKENFEQLQLRLYQLDRLIEVNFPDLWQHFIENGIESHMYASQWFLTIFTAKFPLFLVFRVLDCFLFFGFESIFQVALGILKVSKKDMLNLDFEGLMRYFRVNIPKRYRSEENAKHLMAVATSIKLKKLSKYEKEWVGIKAAERAAEDPVIRYERENKKLLSDNLRLDTENDNLARQLVNSKIEMRKEIDEIEDEKDFYEKDLSTTKLQLKEALEEKRRLHVETEQLKALLKRELDKLDAELVTRNNVIAEYKMITSQLSDKLEKAQKGDGAGTKAAPPASDDGSGSKDTLDKANDRIRELELELAQTKLALVETECKNQDLTHQFNATVQNLEQQQQQQQSSSKSGTWFSKTLSSIKETTASAATTAGGHMVRSSTSAAVSGGKESLKKSSSIDVLKHAD